MCVYLFAPAIPETDAGFWGVQAVQFVLKHPAQYHDSEDRWYKADGDFHRPPADFHIRLPRAPGDGGPFWCVLVLTSRFVCVRACAFVRWFLVVGFRFVFFPFLFQGERVLARIGLSAIEVAVFVRQPRARSLQVASWW